MKNTNVKNVAINNTQATIDNQTTTLNINGDIAMNTLTQTVANITTEETSMKYIKLIKSLKDETVIALHTNEEFKLNFSRYVSAKDKEAFESTVAYVYGTIVAKTQEAVVTTAEGETLTVEEYVEATIVANSSDDDQEDTDMDDIQLPLDFEDEDEEYTAGELAELASIFNSEAPAELPEGLENIKGLVKYEFTKEQLADQSAISFIEKTIAYARVLWCIEYHSQYDTWNNGMNPWAPVLGAIKGFITKDLTQNNPVALRAWQIAKESEVLKDSFSKACSYMSKNEQNPGKGWEYIVRTSLQMKSYIFAKYTSNGFVCDVNPNSWVAKKWTGTPETNGIPATVAINEKSIGLQAAVAASKVVVMINGVPHKFMTPKMVNPIDSYSNYITLFEALYIMRVCKVDVKSLLSSMENTIFVTYDNDGVLGVCREPVALVLNSSLAHLIGPSSPDSLDKGLLKLNKIYKGFAEFVPGVGYNSIESTAAKVIARSMKLDKPSKHTVTLETVYAVVDYMGNARARKALSTGTVHVPSSVTRKHGQFRAVSSADIGGFKCTTAPVAIINREWDEANISLASFGSMKSKGYGVQQLLGLTDEEFKTNIDSMVKTLKFWGKPIKVVELKNVELNITNNYTIQAYESTARNKLVMSLAEADAAILERAEERASTINEDSVFVDFICEQRDTIFGGDLIATIKALLKSGDIKKKNKKVSVTPSEFGIMTTTYGEAKSREWADSLLAENKGGKKSLEMYRALRIGSLTFEADAHKMHTVDAVYFYNKIYNIMVDNGIDANVSVPAFTSRNFLVDLAKAFSDCSGRYIWLKVVGENRVAYLPLGEFMYGTFAEESTIYDTKVQVTGFLSSLLKHITYGTKYIKEHPGVDLYADKRFSKIFDQFVYNIENELQAYTLGKKLGKLKADGISAVLAVAWWTDTIDNVWALGKKYYKTKGKQAVIVKHPELFDESITGVNVFGFLPKAIINKLTKEQLEAIAFGFEGTVFVSEEMALSLQND